MNKILVWDWPVRLGHWLMVGGFTLAWLTGDSETFRLLHVIAGATVLGVATFRLPWGLIGSRYARFVDFVRGPAAVKNYLTSLLRLQPTHHVGHNPAGGWAIVLLLGLGSMGLVLPLTAVAEGFVEDTKTRSHRSALAASACARRAWPRCSNLSARTMEQ